MIAAVLGALVGFCLGLYLRGKMLGAQNILREGHRQAFQERKINDDLDARSERRAVAWDSSTSAENVIARERAALGLTDE